MIEKPINWYFIILILGLVLIPPNHTICQADTYDLHISTMEVVDKDGDHKKEGIEIFYILKKEKENIELIPSTISHFEAYLYEDREDEVLISFWRIDDPKELISRSSIIYLPFRQGFAYNIYIDKIVPAFLKIKIIFNDDREICASLKDRLSFLVLK